DEVVAECRVRDPPAARVGDGLFERGHADAADGPADELAAGELLVEDPAAIGDRDDARDPQHAELGVDLDFGEARTEGAGGNRSVRGTDELAAHGCGDGALINRESFDNWGGCRRVAYAMAPARRRATTGRRWH